MAEQLDPGEKMPSVFLEIVFPMPNIGVLRTERWLTLIINSLSSSKVRLEFSRRSGFAIETLSGRTLIFLLSRIFK